MMTLAKATSKVSKRTRSALVDGLLLGSANLLFGLEPVVYFRTGLIAADDVQLVGAAADALFERKCFD
jgi:hypothetical protein